MMERTSGKFSRHVLGASRKQKIHSGSRRIYECQRCGHRYKPEIIREPCPICGYGRINKVHSMTIKVVDIQPIAILREMKAMT